MQAPVKIKEAAKVRIEEEGKKNYPYECCGILLGKNATICEIFPVKNIETKRLQDRFILDPKGYLEAEEKAQEQNLKILGFYHTHPDHPAKPSQTDLAWAWPDYYYLILSVKKGMPENLGLFTLVDNKFVELELIVA